MGAKNRRIILGDPVKWNSGRKERIWKSSKNDWALWVDHRAKTVDLVSWWPSSTIETQIECFAN